MQITENGQKLSKKPELTNICQIKAILKPFSYTATDHCVPPHYQKYQSTWTLKNLTGHEICCYNTDFTHCALHYWTRKYTAILFRKWGSPSYYAIHIACSAHSHTLTATIHFVVYAAKVVFLDLSFWSYKLVLHTLQK